MNQFADFLAGRVATPFGTSPVQTHRLAGVSFVAQNRTDEPSGQPTDAGTRDQEQSAVREEENRNGGETADATGGAEDAFLRNIGTVFPHVDRTYAQVFQPASSRRSIGGLLKRFVRGLLSW